MPTIKTKKEMNLPELIEWGWKNKEQIERKEFKSNARDSFGNYSTVQFSVDGYGFKTDGVSHKDTFTVEIEEEITEDTVLPKILEIANDGCSGYATLHERTAINEVVRKSSIAFYFLNEDLSLTLIWTKEKGLVE